MVYHCVLAHINQQFLLCIHKPHIHRNLRAVQMADKAGRARREKMDSMQNVFGFRDHFFRHQCGGVCAGSIRFLNNLRPPYSQKIEWLNFDDNILFSSRIIILPAPFCCFCLLFLLQKPRVSTLCRIEPAVYSSSFQSVCGKRI